MDNSVKQGGQYEGKQRADDKRKHLCKDCIVCSAASAGKFLPADV